MRCFNGFSFFLFALLSNTAPLECRVKDTDLLEKCVIEEV